MNIKEAIDIVNAFKKESVKETLKDLEKLDKTILITDFANVFSASKIIKEASTQINEIVHASGIMLAQSVWLDENEIIQYLSLGAGNHKNKYDFETNLRIAEFKFGKWNDDSANGIRRRGYFSNYISLLTANDPRSKYFVVEDKSAFEKFLKGTSQWKNVLSKNRTGYTKLEKFLRDNKMDHVITVGEIYTQYKEIVTINLTEQKFTDTKGKITCIPEPNSVYKTINFVLKRAVKEYAKKFPVQEPEPEQE